MKKKIIFLQSQFIAKVEGVQFLSRLSVKALSMNMLFCEIITNRNDLFAAKFVGKMYVTISWIVVETSTGEKLNDFHSHDRGFADYVEIVLVYISSLRVQTSAWSN